VRKAWIVATFGHEGGSALAGIEDGDVAAVTGEVNGRCQCGRSSVDDKTNPTPSLHADNKGYRDEFTTWSVHPEAFRGFGDLDTGRSPPHIY
jgi:hypothetical protein